MRFPENPSALDERRLATTVSGSIGIVPAEARVGDTFLWSESTTDCLPVGLVRIKELFVQDSDLEKVIRHSSSRFTVENPPIVHCAFIGECYFSHNITDSTYWRRSTSSQSMVDPQLFVMR